MAGKLNIPNFLDVRNKLKRHSFFKFPVLNIKGKTHIIIHHGMTRRSQSGANAEGYARFHVETNGWPGIAYNYVIEPDGTVKWCNDLELRTFHVGNHNNYCVGICLVGDFRYEKPTKEQEQSLRNVVRALQKEHPQMRTVKGHNELSGYEWKPCPAFDFRKVLAEKGTPVQTLRLPEQYKIQEGDTYWSIAKGLDVSVEELERKNPGIDPKNLKIGQVINIAGNQARPSKPAKPAGKQYITFPASSDSWRVYPLSASPTKGNEKGFLNPQKFGGLTYEILEEREPHVYVIQTANFGKVKAYGHPDTGVTFSGGTPSVPKKKEYVRLPSSSKTWKTYKLNVQPVSKNSDWSLTPARYGGLEYEVLGHPYTHVVTINTSRGKRNIYVAPSTGARLYSK